MTAFLDGAAEAEQGFGDFLAGGAQDVDQGAGEGFVVFGEEGDGEAGGGGAAGSVL